MKAFIAKCADILKTIFGYGIMLCLFLGGMTFFGYLAALIIGGETATAICTFLYKTLFPVIIRGGSILVLLGLLGMYLAGETALSTAKKSRKK